jgi:ParB family transcriptional regulator, chromosome partitioning protein
MPKPQELRELPVDLIDPNLSQPRRYFDEETLDALAGSVGERGVLQPVLVRPLENGRYGLVAGERRWRAAKLAGLQSIPALVSRYDDAAALEAGLIENMAREDLTPVEEARACATLANELGMTHRQIGDRLGRHMSVVSNLIRLLNFSDEILELLDRGMLSAGHGKALLTAKDPQERSRLARETVERGWTVVTLENHVRESNVTLLESQDAEDADTETGEGLDSAHAQARQTTAMNLARVWGDALGAEVQVRTMPGQKLRVELLFDSPEGAFALGGKIGEAIARGAKRR